MRKVGLHIRLNGSLDDAIKYCKELDLSIFQAFLVKKNYGKPLECSHDEIERFRAFIHDHALMAFAHGSYLVNAANAVPLSSHYIFRREMKLANLLGFTHMVLHPGAPPSGARKQDGVDALARFVNTVLHQYKNIRLVLENVAFAAPSIGGDLYDFRQVLEKVTMPDRLAFCIDTAHAHSYGYDLITPEGQEQFVHHIDETVGISRVVLMHVNDTNEQRGSCADRHEIVGSGKLGYQALRSLAMHTQLLSLPLLMEPPTVSVEQERTLLNDLRSWY